ncbi:hypothetical protein HPB49_022881 [Dermacentor silvarum]|uniref:Uncharacterized protein n=1 Tax=Dermacentor silvarum TaxID=543639 RepID=A0ACB8D0L4_DERSI|nr:hypothetical protein HPB49_022881 [Dermacentor silvarum]
MFFAKLPLFLLSLGLGTIGISGLAFVSLSGSATHSSDHGPAHSADWPDPGPGGSGDFYEDQFRLGNANSLRPTAPYDADRQRALLEGPFHRAPVQQLSLTSPTNDPAPCSILESCSALSRLYKYYATITWTVHDRLLENFINRPTLSTVKNDVPVKISKIAINQRERLRSDNGKFVFECTALSTRSQGRYLYKPSEPPCDYSEPCVFAQLNGVCTDHLIGDCALEFVRSLDGKTCDKLQTIAGNVLDSPARPTANATLPEPLASRTSVRAPATDAQLRCPVGDRVHDVETEPHVHAESQRQDDGGPQLRRRVRRPEQNLEGGDVHLQRFKHGCQRHVRGQQEAMAEPAVDYDNYDDGMRSSGNMIPTPGGDGTRRESAGLILKAQLGTTGAENEVTVQEHRPSFPLGIADPSSSSGAASKDQPSNISSSSDDGALQLLDPWDTDPSAVDLLILRAEEQRNKSPTPAHAKPSGQCLLCPVPSLSPSSEVSLVPGNTGQPSLRDVCCPEPPPHQGNSGSTSVSSSYQLQPTPTPRGSSGSGGGRPSVPIPATGYQGLAFKQASAAVKTICQNDPLPRSSISENTPAAPIGAVAVKRNIHAGVKVRHSESVRRPRHGGHRNKAEPMALAPVLLNMFRSTLSDNALFHPALDPPATFLPPPRPKTVRSHRSPRP